MQYYSHQSESSTTDYDTDFFSDDLDHVDEDMQTAAQTIQEQVRAWMLTRNAEGAIQERVHAWLAQKC
eukprot:SAG31_NODE_5007_length_2806_cov_2.299224_2_plen_68_part_00